MIGANAKIRLKNFFCGSYGSFITNILKERGIVNPTTGRPFNSQYVRLVVNGRLENIFLENAIFQIEMDLKNGMRAASYETGAEDIATTGAGTVKTTL